MKKLCIVLIIFISSVSYTENRKQILVKDECELVSINNVNNYIKKLGKYYYRLPNKYIKIDSSSYLKDNKYSYPAKNAIDDNINTSWAEGVKGFGKDEWVKLSLDLSKVKGETSEIVILPGYGKSEVFYKKNNRIKSLLLKNNKDNYYARWSFKDQYTFYANTISNHNEKQQEITLYIEDVYKGSKYDDTCIAEIIVVMYNFEEGPDTSPL